MATITTGVQGSTPPRILVTVEDLVFDDAETITVYREVAGTRTVLRGADGQETSGNDAFVRTDDELPFGVPVTYVAEVIDSLGNVTETASAPVTVESPGVWLSDAVSGAAVSVVIEDWPEKTRSRRATAFVVGGRTVVVSGPRGGAASSPVFLTLTDEGRTAMGELLTEATSGVIQIRQGDGREDVDGYVAVLEENEGRPDGDDPLRIWTLAVVEAEAWPTALGALGFTLEDLSGEHETLLDVSNAYATLLDIAQADFS